MPPSQDLPLETFNTTDMSSEADPNAITGSQLTPGAIQIDPSTLSQVLTGAIQLAQSGSSANKNLKASNEMRRPRSSKPPARTPPKSKPAKRKSKSHSRNSKVNTIKKRKKATSESEDDDDESSGDEDDESGAAKKRNPHWEKDDNGNGKSSMYILLDWLTEEGNYDRYKDNKCEKRSVAEEIERYMIKNGIFSRDAPTIGKKIVCLEKSWRDANGIRCRTGEGSLTTARDRKAVEGWADDDPKWLSLEKVALAPILKKCKYYFELEPFFETRHSNTRLAPAHSLANDESDDVEILTQHQGMARDQSVHSQLADDDLKNGIHNEDLELQSNLPHHDDMNMAGLDESMNVIKQLLDNEDNDGDIFESNPITPSRPTQTRYQGPTSSLKMKRTSSKTSLASSSVESSRKRGSSQKSGSAASIQDLIKNNPLDKEIDIINGPVSQLHTRQLDRLSQLADNVASHLFPPPEKTFLTDDDAKKKAKIKLDMAAVQLKSEKKKLQQHDFDLISRREKHNLEMQRYQAEINHEQISRHAQLISMLMKENNLSLQDAMIAAQSAQAMVQLTSNIQTSSTLQSSSTKAGLRSEEQGTDISSSDD
ncbi:hypothetical protein DFH28DRAFT_1127640 [Melampsora americana]|nr:hypothetical protein DFH28DRAFT_1127640 [Melampsora americana]